VASSVLRTLPKSVGKQVARRLNWRNSPWQVFMQHRRTLSLSNSEARVRERTIPTERQK
jgi:hypothetical protein